MAVDGDRGARVDQARGLTAGNAAGRACRHGRRDRLYSPRPSVRFVHERQQHAICRGGRSRPGRRSRFDPVADRAVRRGCGGRADDRPCLRPPAFDRRPRRGDGCCCAAAAMFDTAPEPMVLAMGALNAAMHRAGKVAVSLTFVTGTLVRFGQGFGDFLAGRGSRLGLGGAGAALGGLGRRRDPGRRRAGADRARRSPGCRSAAACLLFVWSLVIPAPE